MISVIMPYWNRLELLKRSLARMAEFYPDYDMEIVIADDGSKEECKLDDDYPWKVRILYLPRKDRALNPCVPINKAVEISRGYITVLTNPEVLHTKPIFGEMIDELVKFGPRGYVIAATWSSDKKKWYCHSSVTEKKNRMLGRLPLPPNSGLHFCTMMYKKFYDTIGGFDEAYRHGQGVEDNDFLWNLYTHDAQFSLRDDLVVFHEGTDTAWPAGGIETNTAIYKRKWSHVDGAI